MIIENHLALDCPCTANCERHSRCAECVNHHFQKGNLPACLREFGRKLKAERKQAERLARKAKKN